MGKLDGSIAIVTGSARGQGRAHATTLAREGADIIAVDICHQIASVPYPLASPEDLQQTAKEVEALGRRVFTAEVDIRDDGALKTAYEAAFADLGAPDIIVANAGIAPITVRPHEREWHDVVDVNLTGTYNTVQLAIPAMIERSRGGAIVMTSSTHGLKGMGGSTPGSLGYVATKHAIVGLMRAWANFLAPHDIRVNSVHPTGVPTPMVMNDAVQEVLRSDPSIGAGLSNALPVPMVEVEDVANAVAWLVSDAARYVTGVALPVDAGFTNKV